MQLKMPADQQIRILHAREHNLKSVSLSLPVNRLIVVTGVSGSGKSSLIFDVLYREAESRYLGSFSSYARQFMGKMHKPEVEEISGLSPAIALDQRMAGANPRSTVGTVTGIYDTLRLLFARCGKLPAEGSPLHITRSLFSFNTSEGACPECKGLGVVDFLDPELLVADKNKTLREGALVITAPNGYIIYSQVTLEVLDQVCRAEGFHIDIPWKDLQEEQKKIILYGSDKIEIPFGKHPLESRMKWSGITAKPREMGYYKGILPVMETILKRDRNRNILRFVRTVTCPVCQGRRLNPQALSVTLGGENIAGLASLPLSQLDTFLSECAPEAMDQAVAGPVIHNISRQIRMLSELGLGYLSLSRAMDTLSGGEIRRLRLASVATMDLTGMIFILDEPSAGLHASETMGLIRILQGIRDRGNTVIVVEHDEEFMRSADWLTDIGPGAGDQGGNLLFNGPLESIRELAEEEIRKSRTLSLLLGKERPGIRKEPRSARNMILIEGAELHNLRKLDAAFRLQALNVVTGVSGAGKSTLVHYILAESLQQSVRHRREIPHHCRYFRGWEAIGKVIMIDSSPIGRTPRSNPATYTGLFDLIRDLYAAQPLSVVKGYDKSRFSFNTPGGRCETCEGAGYQQIGMHFMGHVEVPCESCEGRRFDPETLEVRYNGTSISEVLGMTVGQASVLFQEEPGILRPLQVLSRLGLDYLTLGQRSSTLSGGEAQRIKLAAELTLPQAPHTLYIMDEPTTGLHMADTEKLMDALNSLVDQGHTVVLIEHHPLVILNADHVIDLGPGSGNNGGRIMAAGTPAEVMDTPDSITGRALCAFMGSYGTSPERESTGSGELKGHDERFRHRISASAERRTNLCLTGVRTHNLKNISVDIPKGKITVLTGVSGSGKSSLAFDTIHAEAQNRFMEGFSAYERARTGMMKRPDFDGITGLTPTLALEQDSGTPSLRSTVGTLTGIYDLYRLLFARLAIRPPDHPEHKTVPPSSGLFSFNHQQGACPECTGIGEETLCDPLKLITHAGCSILAGAMDGTKTGKFYGDPSGQYTATIRAVGKIYGISFEKPWQDLTKEEKELVLNGTGEQEYDVEWTFQRNKRSGVHHFRGAWTGLLDLVNREFIRKHADHRGESMMNVMSVQPCRSCHGKRLKPEVLAYTVGGFNIASLSEMPASGALQFLSSLQETYAGRAAQAATGLLTAEIIRRLKVLSDLGLSYLSPGRSARTLSSGEMRRVRMASLIDSGLTGITYILDEPTAGLHPRDTAGLMKHIRQMRDSGNTVLMIEHDREAISAADHVIELGPEAGIRGGRIMAKGTPAELMEDPGSLTSAGLRLQNIASPPSGRILAPGLEIRGAMVHNLKGFDLHIPSGGMIVVTGVSGSGKSSLVFDVIHASSVQQRPSGCRMITGLERFNRVIDVGTLSSAPQGLSVIATYTGLMDLLRDRFAAEPEALSMGLTRQHFSFHNRQGQCPVCEGRGAIITPMDFLPDAVTPCEGCGGQRYNPQVLKVLRQGKSIAGVLELTVAEALEFFRQDQKMAAILHRLTTIGLGYLTPGQSLSTLSGGEMQRLYLVSELMRPVSGKSLFLMDEPTAGLHYQDIMKLLPVLNALVDEGHTVVVIEHDPVVIGFADHVIELGPEGGQLGGYLQATDKKTASFS